MTTNKWISAPAVLMGVLLVSPVFGQEQEAPQQKTETKIIVIEETTDRFGKTTRTKTVHEGTFTDEEIDAIVKQEMEESEDQRLNRSPFDHDVHGKGGYLGVTIENTDEGVRITNVAEGSAAGKAGLKEGDILTAINDKEVADVEDLVGQVSSYATGTAVQVAYTREGDAQTAEAVLDERPRLQWRGVDKQMHEHKEKLREEHEIKGHKPRFGVGIDQAEDGGALVTQVYEGSLADQAGLQEGDIITAFNGVQMSDPEALIKAVRAAEAGQEVTIDYQRDGATQTTKTTFED